MIRVIVMARNFKDNNQVYSNIFKKYCKYRKVDLSLIDSYIVGGLVLIDHTILLIW